MPANKRMTIDEAYQAYRKSHQELTKAVERVFPVGSLVEVTIARARIRGSVQAVGGWRPAEVYVINIATGKRRHFWAADPNANPILIRRTRRAKG